MKLVLDKTFAYAKSTKSTHVYVCEEIGMTVYVPRSVVPQVPPHVEILISVPETRPERLSNEELINAVEERR